jgi:hypothetical protein
MEFNNKVKEIIYPKLEIYGFSIKEDSPGFVVFESNNLELRFVYDYVRSKDKIVFIYSKYGNSRGFSIVEYINYLKEVVNKELQFSPAPDIVKWVELIYSLLILDGSSLLEGNKDYLTKIENYAMKKDDAYNLELQLNQIKSDIQRAWQRKDFKEIVVLLEPIYDILPLSLKKRYDYSLKQLNKK